MFYSFLYIGLLFLFIAMVNGIVSLISLSVFSLLAYRNAREIKETIPFTIAMKRIKYLEIYLPKESKKPIYRKP